MLKSICYNNLFIQGNIFAAPLAGYSNFPSRMIFQEFGADLTFTEMVSARGIVHQDKKTLDLLYTDKKEQAKVVQIFDNDKYILKDAIDYIQDKTPYTIVNINAGCSVKKILKAEKGGALLRDEVKLKEILNYLSSKIKIHLTLKIRSGWDFNHINYLTIGKLAQDNNCKMIIFHPRTVKQMFSGIADWDLIYKLKSRIKIPVIGSGDIYTPEDAKSKFQKPIDGIMIARGAIGNPWLFYNIKKFIKNNEYSLPDTKEKISVMMMHLKKMIEFFGEKKGIILFRCQMLQYIKNFKNSAIIRKKLQTCENLSEIENVIMAL